MPPTPIPYPTWAAATGLEPLSEAEGRELAETFPTDPYSVLLGSGLRTGVDRAFVAGPRQHPEAVIVQHSSAMTEPEFSGPDVEAGWGLLSRLPGWDCLNGGTPAMTAFAPILEREVGLPVRWLGDLFYTLEGAPIPHHDPSVRLLGPEDVDRFRGEPRPPWAGGYRTYEELLTEGIVAGAMVDGNIVAAAACTAANARYADVGVHTLEPFRRRGLSSAAVYLVAREIRARGLTPSWSTGSHNLASQRVAEKVGFRPYGRGEYLVIDALRAQGGWKPR